MCSVAANANIFAPTTLEDLVLQPMANSALLTKPAARKPLALAMG
jgi:hypothetical protein